MFRWIRLAHRLPTSCPHHQRVACLWINHTLWKDRRWGELTTKILFVCHFKVEFYIFNLRHSLSPSVLLHNQNMTIKYSQEPLPLVSEIVQPETLTPSMLSPHSQASQGLNLSANQVFIFWVTFVNYFQTNFRTQSFVCFQTVGSSDYISSTMMSAPSTRDWGFKVAYEPQPSQSIPTKMPTENDMLYPVMKRPRCAFIIIIFGLLFIY